MLFLVFKIDDERYCLEVSRIVEITHLVTFKKIPHAPAYFSGLFNYRGTVVPVIDLSILISGRPSKALYSTRIILVDYVSMDKKHHILGLLAEKATETISCREDEFQPSGIEVDGAKYLGDVLYDEKGMIQRVRIEKLPSEAIWEYEHAALKENNEIDAP